jgi:hypothetical protein
MRLNCVLIWFFLVFALFSSTRASALTQVVLEGAFDNIYLGANGPLAVTFSAGGNVGPYPDWNGQVPVTTTGDIQLQRSVFGFMVAGPLGYPDAVEDLQDAAENLIKRGTLYKTASTFPGGEGQTGIGEGAWDIRFPGVRSQATGELLVVDLTNQVVDQNYFEEDIIAAAELYRAILRIDPYNTGAIEGLLQTYYERMVPLIFAGNTCQVWAFRSRISGNSLQHEIDLLEEGRSFYEMAAEVFIDLTGTLPDVTFFDGTSVFADHSQLRIPDSGENIAVVPKLMETYARAVASQAETTAHKVDRWYLDVFEYPVLPFEIAPQRQEIFDYVMREAARMQNEVMLADAFMDVFSEETKPIYTTDIGRAAQMVSELLTKSDFIKNGYVSFAIERGADGAVTAQSYGVYAPEFVPFLYRDPEGLVQFPNSYLNLSERARDIVTRAIAWEGEARHEDRTFDNNQQELNDRFEGIRTKYFDELAQLCGQIRDPESGELVPDIVFALFPPWEREKQHEYIAAAGETKGAIYQQWLTMKAKETEVDAAMLDLENLVSEMAKKQEIATKIAGGIENLAQLVLENGEKLSALEIQRGDLIAKQIEYEDRKSQEASIFNMVLNFASNPAILVSAITNPFSALSVVNSVANTYNQVYTAHDIANNKTQTQRELSKIDAQKERIRAFESAEVQFQHRDEVLLKTEEEVHSMILNAERLKLNILMAEQRLDMEHAELSNLSGRVAFLLQEWARADYLAANNPIGRPDYRLIRDIRMRDADEAFVYAQERCYLAAKAAEYRVNGNPNDNTMTNILEGIIKARRSQDLLTGLDYLNNEIENLQIQQGARQTHRRTMSVRNFLIQNNYIVEDENGDPDLEQSLYEAQIDAAGSLVTSDEAWHAFLQDHLVFDGRIDAYKLEFVFSTSLNRPNASRTPDPDDPELPLSARRNNPLHIPNSTVMLLSWTGDDHTQQNGVTINIRGRQLSMPFDDDVVTTLKQEGSSAVRFKTWDSDWNSHENSIRFWNLQPVLANVISAINGDVNQTLPGDDFRPSTPQFHERSPANDRWVLTIREDMCQANQALLNQIDRITDIVLTFDVTYFTPK